MRPGTPAPAADPAPEKDGALHFLAGDGEMARRIRSHDWSQSLGPAAAWPQPLKVALRIALTTRHPVFIFWGPDHICLYNDAYAQSMGPEKHPAMLGVPGAEAWAELWDVIEPQIDLVMAGRGATWHENQPLRFLRHGSFQESFWTYSCSPIDDDHGVGGVMVLTMETTAPMLAARQTSLEATRLRTLFDSAPGLMAVLKGPDHRHEVTNAAYDRFVGGRATIGSPVAEAFPEIAGQGFVALLDTVYRTAERYTASDRHVVFDDGPNPAREFYVDFVFEPMFADDGAVSGIFIQGVDVTELHVMRSNLRESERRFRTMADNAPIMLWVTQPDGRCIWLNARWYEYTGQSEPEALGLGWIEAVHPDEREMARAAFLASNAAQTAFRVEYRLRAADGSYRWALDAAVPRFSAGGAYMGFVGSVIDIDDRRASEDRLRSSEARFRAAVAAIQGVLWTNSPDGRMTGLQPGWSALTGQTEDEYRDFGWSTAVHPDDAQATIDAWNAAVADKRPFIFEHRVRRRDGRWSNFAVRAIPIVDNGAITEWVGVHTDITDQRAAETALQTLNNTLEDRIAAELEHRAQIEASLSQAQKMEAIGQLTSGLAHDFNNMLTVVISSLHLLERQIDPQKPRAARYLGAALQGASRAAGLVDRLMTFSRRQPLQLASTDVTAVITAMAEMLANAAPAPIRLDFDLDHGLPSVDTDAALLESAILNLVVNARDAMPAGGRITVAATVAQITPAAAILDNVPPGPYVEISVTDTGEGMAPEVVANAFNPFFTTKEIGKGTGLGLSQVHGFARQSGGVATITSAPGKGTTVRILLPLRA